MDGAVAIGLLAVAAMELCASGAKLSSGERVAGPEISVAGGLEKLALEWGVIAAFRAEYSSGETVGVIRRPASKEMSAGCRETDLAAAEAGGG